MGAFPLSLSLVILTEIYHIVNSLVYTFMFIDMNSVLFPLDKIL